MTTLTIAEVAGKLTPKARQAWLNAEWEGEYFNPPDLPSIISRADAIAYGLLERCDSFDDLIVTKRGEELIFLLRRQQLPMWKRILLAVFPHV